MMKKWLSVVLITMMCVCLGGCAADLSELSDEILAELDGMEETEIAWIEAPYDRVAMVVSETSLRAAPSQSAEAVLNARAEDVLVVVSSAQSADSGLWYGVNSGSSVRYIEAGCVRLLTEEEVLALGEIEEEEPPVDEEHTPGEGTAVGDEMMAENE